MNDNISIRNAIFYVTNETPQKLIDDHISHMISREIVNGCTDLILRKKSKAIITVLPTRIDPRMTGYKQLRVAVQVEILDENKQL